MTVLALVTVILFALLCAEPLGCLFESTYWGQRILDRLGLGEEDE